MKTDTASSFPGIGLSANLLGLVVYLLLVIIFAPPPVPQGEMGGPADGLLLVFTAIPVLIFFILFNLVWLVAILISIRRRGMKGLGVWVLVSLAWIGVNVLGFHIVQFMHAQ